MSRKRGRRGAFLFCSLFALIAVAFFLSQSLDAGHKGGRIAVPFRSRSAMPLQEEARTLRAPDEYVRDVPHEKDASNISSSGFEELPSDEIVELPVTPISLKTELHSAHAILVRLEDGAVLLDQAIHEKTYPASLTKIMTAIVAIERLSNLNEPIVLDQDVFSSLQTMNASVAGFVPEERAHARDLLYAVMLPSGADAAIGLAAHIAGSDAAFVDYMNEKARALGMENTHFTNTTGLHDEEHYTTVFDLSLLLEDALKNETFAEIFKASRYSVLPTNMHPDGFTFYSTLSQKLENPDFPGGGILGGKTGYTSKAGLCLATLAEKDGTEYILITTAAPGDHSTEPYHIEDAFSVYKSIE